MSRKKKKQVKEKGDIKEKLEKLISSLLDDALTEEITLDSLATKTAIAKTAIEYLKISKDKKEDEGSWFMEEFQDDKTELQSKLSDVRADLEETELEEYEDYEEGAELKVVKEEKVEEKVAEDDIDADVFEDFEDMDIEDMEEVKEE